MKTFLIPFSILVTLGQLIACSHNDPLSIDGPGVSVQAQDAGTQDAKPDTDAGPEADAPGKIRDLAQSPWKPLPDAASDPQDAAPDTTNSPDESESSDAGELPCLTKDLVYESKPKMPVVEFGKGSCSEDETVKLETCLTTGCEVEVSDACYTCVMGDVDAGALGALGPLFVTLVNFEACIDYFIPGAGQAHSDAWECSAVACQKCSTDDVSPCYTEADNTVCKSFRDSYAEILKTRKAEAAPCFRQLGEDHPAVAARIVRLFCGPKN